MSTRVPPGGLRVGSMAALPGTDLWTTAQWVGSALTGVLSQAAAIAPVMVWLGAAARGDAAEPDFSPTGAGGWL